MATKQIQQRRGTAAVLATKTPALGESAFDTTNNRLNWGNGVMAGGVPHCNYADQRNTVFSRGTVAGTTNALTITLSPAATSYSAGMKLGFVAPSTTTNALTVNVDGLGAVTVYKVQGASIVSTVAGDFVAGGYYEIYYDGTRWLLISGGGGATLASIGQGQLKTSTGTISLNQTITGGPGGLWLSLQGNELSGVYGSRVCFNNAEVVPGGSFTVRGSSVLLPGGKYGFYPETIINSLTSANARQEYITSSPPYDLGDGDVAGFFFVLVNETGDIVSHYAADTPPWAYNGPTNIEAHRQCPVSGKKYALQNKTKLEDILDGAPNKIREVEITHKLKNADMKLIPHPFGTVPEGHTVVLFDPMEDRIRRMVDFQNMGGSEQVIEEIRNGKFRVDSACKRCGPKGVAIHKLKYKYTAGK